LTGLTALLLNRRILRDNTHWKKRVRAGNAIHLATAREIETSSDGSEPVVLITADEGLYDAST
jgi:hypothetical protein